MASNPYLQLLAELGIDIPETVWNEVHNIPPPPPPPSRCPDVPVDYTDDDVPVFLSTQVEWEGPEMYGYDRYEVHEVEETAHPLRLDYKSEQYYRANFRGIHRYSRAYRIRWVYFHLVGSMGRSPPALLARLKAEAKAEGDPIWNRGVYEWVRGRLRGWKLARYYHVIPRLVADLGGPRWRIRDAQHARVLEDATRLHRLFDALARAGKLCRQRFPSLTFVLLFLLDRHGVMAPYRIPWARTYISRKGLRTFLDYLQGCLTTGSLSSEIRPPPTASSASAPANGPTDSQTSAEPFPRRPANPPQQTTPPRDGSPRPPPQATPPAPRLQGTADGAVRVPRQPTPLLP